MTDSQHQFDELELLFNQNELAIDTHIQNLNRISRDISQLDVKSDFDGIHNALNSLLHTFIDKSDPKQDAITELRNSVGDGPRAYNFNQIIDAIEELDVSEEYMLQLNRTIQVLRD
ncbi:uncharacterized protein SPAPADRAFT_60998, partial [Spathaspora passalidarum NRRL Y-27907]